MKAVSRNISRYFQVGAGAKAYHPRFVLSQPMQDASEPATGPAVTVRARAMRAGNPLLTALCAVFVSLAVAGVQAANIATTQSGDWDAATTWVGGVPPGSGDDVTIASGHVVTLSVDAAAATIIIADNTIGTNGITINSGIRLDVGGAITMIAPTTGTSTISVGAGILSAASIVIPGSATAGRNCAVTVGTGTINITGSITFTGTAAQAQFVSTGASTVNVGGNFESGGTLTTTSTGTINFNGSSAQTLGTYTTYNNIAINNTFGGVSLTGTTTIGGALTVNAGTFTVGAYTLVVTGATSVAGRLSITSATGTKTFTGDVTINSGGIWDNTSGNEAIDLGGSLLNDGTFGAGTGVHTFSGVTKTISGVSVVSISNLTVNGTVTNNGTLTVSTALAGSGTLTNGASSTLNLGGTLSVTTLTATAASNTVNYSGAAQTARAITYYHLAFSGSGVKTLANVGTINGNLTLSGTCSAATAIATTISGNFSVGAGTTFTAAGYNLTVTGTTSVAGTLAHSSATGTKTYNGLVTIESGGSWTNAGNSAITFQGGLTHNGTTFSSGTGVYTFGINAQTVESGSALAIANVTVTGVTLTNNSTNFTVSTALSGTGDLVQGTGATLNIGGTSGITTLDATAGSNTVNYNGAAQTVKPTTYYHITLSGSGAKTFTNVGTIYGNLTLSGTCSATTAIGTSIGGNFSVGTGTTFTVAGYNFTVAGTTSVSGTLAHSSAIGTKTHVGLVTIESGGSWTNAGNSAITFQGGLTYDGTTFSSGTGVYAFVTNAQTIEGASALTINSITVNVITLTNNLTNLTVSTALSGTGELVQGVGATLYIGNTSGITTLTAIAGPNTVNYSGAVQTVKSAGYHHLTLSGSGAKTLPSETLVVNGDFTVLGTVSATAAAAIKTAGSFTIGPSASFNAGSFSHDLKGGFSNNNIFTASGGSITLTGTSDQPIGGTAVTTFNNLTVDKVNGAVIVNTTFNVSEMLTFADGNVNTGANAVVITSTGSVSRTSGHVVGYLRKQVSAASPSQTFEIGDASSYCPLSVSFSGITSTGDLTATVTAGEHPNIESSTIDSIQSVNKYWTLTNSGIIFANYDASFSFNAGDIDAGANTDLFKVGRYAAGVWTYPIVGVKIATSTEATALAEFGDFSLGEDRPDPPVLASIGAQSVAEGDTLVVDVSATDSDGGSLILSAENLPTNAGFSDHGDETGSMSFSPDFTQASVYNVTFIVSDGVLADSEVVAITVTAVNAVPVLAAIGSQSVPEGDTLAIGSSAIDPDGDSLILSAIDLPTNASFTDHGNGTGSMSFSPDSTQVGVYNVTFIVSDGALADSEAVTITVTNVNRKPVLTAIGAQAIAENQTLILHIQSSDPDGTIPTLTSLDLPANATFADSANGAGALMFSPDFTQAGLYTVSFIASDDSLADTLTVAITVTDVNRKPVLTAIGAQTIAENQTLNLHIQSSDPDSTISTLTVLNLPTNATFADSANGAGEFTFTPDNTQTGVHNVSFVAGDGTLADTMTVQITVIHINVKPTLTVPGAQVVNEGQVLTFGLSAVDPEGTIPTLSAIDVPTNATFADSGNGAGALMFSPDFTQAGLYTVTFVASDGPLADTQAVAITVVEHDSVTISGNAGVAGATLSYVDDTTKTTTADSSGVYSFRVPYDWSGTVTLSMTGYAFTPTARTYTNIVTDQIDQDFQASIIVDVGQDEGSLIPDNFQLAQNYPNPFNPTTTIEYSLPRRSRVVVEIYNLLGRVVRTLVDEEKPAGVYQLSWDGTDADSRVVSSGVYLYRIITSNFSQTKKMVLLK